MPIQRSDSIRTGRRRGQRGASIVDALVSFLVVAVGMVSTARLQSHLRLTADHARQRAEASRLAQQDIEQLRAYVALGETAAVGAWRSYAALASATLAAADAEGRNTRYEISRTLSDDAGAAMKAATVTVGWADRQGVAQQLSLNALIARNAPALAAALAVGPAGRPVAPLRGRHIGIPAEASDLGDGRSAFKPAGAGSAAWLQDNRSGRITARCDVAPTLPSRGLSSADLHDCVAAAGLLLSGRVRFALGTAVHADAANDTPLATGIAVAGSSSGSADCRTEAVKVVAFAAGGVTRREAVAIDAVPANLGLAEWSELGDRQLRYHCAIALAPDATRWSGRTTLVPQAWRIGIDSGERRVCRYVADAGSGLASEINSAHPDSYRDADQTLQEQNFLVIDALQRCPAADGGATDASNVATVQHQP